jgi:hypothetical protein
MRSLFNTSLIVVVVGGFYQCEPDAIMVKELRRNAYLLEVFIVVDKKYTHRTFSAIK